MNFSMYTHRLTHNCSKIESSINGTIHIPLYSSLEYIVTGHGIENQRKTSVKFLTRSLPRYATLF